MFSFFQHILTFVLRPSLHGRWVYIVEAGRIVIYIVEAGRIVIYIVEAG